MPSQRQSVSPLLMCTLPGLKMAAQEPAASISLSANGMTEGVLYRGWPLLMEVRVNLEEGESAQLQRPAPVRLIIRDATGAVTWPLKLASTPVDAITLSAESPAVAVWTLGPEATSALPPGEYSIRAEHPAIGASRLILLTVSNEPAELTPEQGSLKTRVRSRIEEWTGTPETALRILTEWLEKAPADIAVLADKSGLLAEMDRLAEALDFADRALTAFTEQVKEARHPPVGLLRRIRSLEARLPQP